MVILVALAGKADDMIKLHYTQSVPKRDEQLRNGKLYVKEMSSGATTTGFAWVFKCRVERVFCKGRKSNVALAS